MDRQEVKTPKGKMEICIDMIYKVIMAVCMAFMAVQVIVVVYVVIGRFVFNSTPKWGEEVALICMVWFSLLSASLAVKDQTHIRMTVTDKFFGKLGLKIKNIILGILNLGFSVCLFWEGIKLIKLTLISKMPGSGLPSAWLYASVSIAGLLLMIMLAYVLGGILCRRRQ